ncbi:YppG family protein [Virgibacillus ainsalahensis]
MYDNPYYNRPDYQNYAHQTAPYDKYAPHYSNSSFEPGFHQTPYEHFAKPKQPEFWPQYMQSYPSYYQSSPVKPGNNNLFAYFQNNEGQVDVDKMISTVGQLANTYHQVSPIVKQFGSLIKSFR